MKFRVSLGVLILLAVVTSGAQQQPRVTGFFTNMHYVREAGDVVGTEVWVVYARGHFYAAFQDAAGEPDPPVVVPVDVSGSQIRFTISTPRAVTHYSGTVGKAGLMLSVEGNPVILLKRQRSYWQ